MARMNAAAPRSYKEAQKLLGNRENRKVGNNTYLVKTMEFDANDLPREAINVHLHGNRIACYHQDSTVSIYDGGWQTVTTKDRLNWVLRGAGMFISQRDWDWYLHGCNDGTVVPFYSSMVVELFG